MRAVDMITLHVGVKTTLTRLQSKRRPPCELPSIESARFLPTPPDSDVKTVSPRDIFTKRVCSFKLPPTGFGDIDYLRNTLGFAMPTEEQIVGHYFLYASRNRPLPIPQPPVFPKPKQRKGTVIAWASELDRDELIVKSMKKSETERNRACARRQRELEERLKPLRTRRRKLQQSIWPRDHPVHESDTTAKTDEILSRLTRDAVIEKKVMQVIAMRKYLKIKSDLLHAVFQKDIEMTEATLEKIKSDKKAKGQRKASVHFANEVPISPESKPRTPRYDSLDIVVNTRQWRPSLRRELPRQSNALDKVIRFIGSTRF